MNNNIQNMLQKLKDLGFNQEQIDEILQIGEEEIVDIVFEDFAFNAPEDQVKEYAKKALQFKEQPQEFAKLFEEVMRIHYGEQNVQAKKEELLAEYLQNIIEITEKSKEVKEKYSQGDPEAVNAVEEAKNSPIVQHMAKKMDEENPQDKG